MFPEALDYVDVYDRAGGLSERAVLAHAVHLSDRELDRLVESGARVAHCPASNLFLASGVMPLGRYLEAGLPVGPGHVIDALKALGVSLRYATRKVQVKWGSDPDSKPMAATVLYVVGFPLGKEPEQFATPKSAGIRL